MASVLLLLGTTLAWAHKDGLGPNAVESHGLLALSRFWRDVWRPFCFLVVPTHLAGWVFYWWDLRRAFPPYLEQRMGSSTAHPLEDAELDGFRGDVEMLAAPGSSPRAL
jgi:hypothetical protein